MASWRGGSNHSPAEHLLVKGGTPISGAFPLLPAAGEKAGKAHPSNFPNREAAERSMIRS